MASALHESADRLDAEVRKAAVLRDDPLAGLLGAAASMTRQMADAVERIEKIGNAAPLNDQVVAAVERASAGIAVRVAGQIDRRAAITVAVALFFAAAAGGAAGFVAGTLGYFRPDPVAVCWQQKDRRVCAPAVWITAVNAARRP